METNIWANLNDNYNIDVIIIENNNLKNFVPKKINKIIKTETFKQIETIEDLQNNVSQIISEDYESLNYLQIIGKQTLVSSYLIKLFRSSSNIDIIWSKYKKFLVWLNETSKFIVEKSKHALQYFKVDKIYRSSYKFCNKKDSCENLYGFISNKSRTTSKCMADHYVHYKLVSDITSVITILDVKTENIVNDLRICLDTINFVINHMYQELNTFNIYYNKEENFDINKYYVCSKKNRF
jgi:hypothetical protein